MNNFNSKDLNVYEDLFTRCLNAIVLRRFSTTRKIVIDTNNAKFQKYWRYMICLKNMVAKTYVKTLH